MKSFLKVLALSACLSPVTALGHFEDDTGLLYCEVVCKVGKSEHKAGKYMKTSRPGEFHTGKSGDYVSVGGKWCHSGLTMLAMAKSGRYEVSASTLAEAEGICEGIRNELLRMEEVRGASEHACKTFPRAKTQNMGLMTFEMIAKTETDL